MQRRPEPNGCSQSCLSQIPAFTHNVSDYLSAATAAGLQFAALDEWWHTDDAGKPPRLITFLFRKTAAS